MPKKPEHALAEELAAIKRRLKAVEAKPKLARSSIDDGRLVTKDRDGVVREIIGRQEDGSHGSRVVVSPPQPTPSAPVLSAGEAAVVSVRWDGQADGAVPLVHGRVDVLAAHVPGGQEPVFSQAEVVSSIRDRDGGGTAFAADQAGTWAVWLVMVGQDRVTRSEPSEVSTLLVSMPVDGDAIQAEIDQAKQDLADAEAEWETARQNLRSDLDTLNNTTIPGLESDLTTTQQDVDTIQNTTIPGVQQDLTDAETAWETARQNLRSDLDALNNTTIPALESDLTTTQQNVNTIQNTTIPGLESDLTDASNSWEQARQGLRSDLDALNNTTIPALESDLSANSTAISDAELRLDTAESDLSTAQQNVDTLQNTTIPNLESDLTTGLSDVRTDAQQWADAAESDAVATAAADAQAKVDALEDEAQRQIDALMAKGGNLLVNGGFEQTAADGTVIGWVGQFNHTTDGARSGSYAASLDARDADGTDKHLWSSWVPSQAGRTFRVTAWVWKAVQGETAVSSTFTPAIRAALSDGASDDTWGTARGREFGTGGYTKMVEDITIPSDLPVSDTRLLLRAQAGSGSYRIDDVSLHDITEAKEALDAAEAAQARADDAHALAGTAKSTADEALTSASGKSTTYFKTTAPSGTAEEGDVWWQYEMRDGRATVTGQWSWINGAWESQEIAEEWLPQVNIGTGTYGQLDGIRLTADSVTSEKVLVGGENMLPNAGLGRPRRDDGTVPFWDDGVYGPGWTRGTVGQSFAQYDLRSATGTSQYDTGVFPIEGGQEYRLRVMVQADISGSTYGVRLVTDSSSASDPDPLLPDASDTVTPEATNTEWKEHVSVFTAPVGATEAYLRIHTNTGAGSTQTAIQRFTAWSMRKMADGELVVDGAIKGRHVEAQSVAAEVGQFVEIDAGQVTTGLLTSAQIDVQELAAQTATVIELDADRITTGQFGAARIDVQSLYANTGFINAFHAETVEAMRVTAETGFIGGVHLANGSVGAQQINASEVGAEVGTFVEIDAGQVITGQLGAARIDVASLYVDTAFVNSLHAEAVEAMRVTAETGFIGGVLLANNSVGARQVVASEVGAEVGTFVEIDAGQVITGQLGAARIDVQQLMAQSAVINTIHTESVEAMKLTAETGFIGGTLLENGAVTTEKLTVTESMTAAIANFLEVKAVHLAANSVTAAAIDAGAVTAAKLDADAINGKTITGATVRTSEDWRTAGGVYIDGGAGKIAVADSSGNMVASLGGDTNFVRGRIEAGGTAGQGAISDVGSFPYWSASTGGNRHAQGVPYLRLSDGTTADNGQPGLVNDGRTLILASGVDDPSTGSRRDIVLDAHTRIPTLAVSSWVEAHELFLREDDFGRASLLTNRLMFQDSSTSRRWGFERRGTSNLQSQVLGEMAHGQGQDDMIIHSRAGSFTLDPGNTMRGTHTYGSPARTGSRWPHVTSLVNTGSTGWDSSRTVEVSGVGSSASSFRWIGRAPGNNGGTVRFNVVAISTWGGE